MLGGEPGEGGPPSLSWLSEEGNRVPFPLSLLQQSEQVAVAEGWLVPLYFLLIGTNLWSISLLLFCSVLAYLKDKLDQYMAQFPKVRILHLKERHGLIRARLAGAEIAKGKKSCILSSKCSLLFAVVVV